MMENIESSQKSNQIEEIDRKNRLFEQIVSYSRRNGGLLFKFHPHKVAQIISVRQLQSWSKLFTNPHNKITLEEFVALFCTGIPHQKEETLYLMLSLIDMFQTVQLKSKNNEGRNSVLYSEISDYLCEKILGCETGLKLEIRDGQQNQQNIGKKSPCIRHLYSESIPHINKQRVNKEKSLKNQLNSIYYCKKIDRIFSLTSFSNSIQLYDRELKLKGKIHPKLSKKYKNQPIITSFAFSDQQQRIGCIVGGINVVFWEACDNFQTQKAMQGVKADKIYFLQNANVWITVRINCISFWDIYHEKQFYQIVIPMATQISCIKQMKKIGGIMVSVCFKNNKRQIYLYQLREQKARLLSKADLQASGCHTLHFNAATQSIIQLGFMNVAKVWEYDCLTYQLMHVGNLVGHHSVILSVQTIGKSSIVMTGDQKGIVRIWDLRQLRCFQTVKIGAKGIKQLLNIDDFVIIGDNRLNLVQLQNKKPMSESKSCIYCIYDNAQNHIYMFTTDSCLIIDMESGQIIQIFIICQSDEQIVTVKKLKQFFYAATNKGNIKIMQQTFQNSKTIKAHQQQVIRLKAQQSQNWLISIGDQRNMVLWLPSSRQNLYANKTLQNIPIDNLEQVQLQIGASDWLIGFTLKKQQICLVDFETFRVCQKLIFPCKITRFQFHCVHPILIVFLQNNRIQLISYQKQKLSFNIKQVIQIQPQNIFNKTYHQDSLSLSHLITHSLINSQNQLLCVTKAKQIQVYDIQNIIETFNLIVEPSADIQQRQEGNLFRPVCEKFQLYSQILVEDNSEIGLNVQKFAIKSPEPLKLLHFKQNIEFQGQVLQFCQNKQKCRLVLLDSAGQLRLLHYKSLQVLCRRKKNQILAELWTQSDINKQQLKQRLIKAIRLNKLIYNTEFRPQVLAQISKDQLNITQFLNNLSLSDEPSTVLKEVNLNSKQRTKSVKKSSVFSTYSASLKIMETQKRLRSSFAQQNQVNFKIMALRRKYSEAMNLPASVEGGKSDSYFMEPIRERFSIKSSEKSQNCQIYQQINQKFENWKKERRKKSLSKLAFEQNSAQKKTINTKKTLKLPIKQKNSKPEAQNLLKIKIEQQCHRRGKGLELIKKYFKREYSQFMKKNK